MAGGIMDGIIITIVMFILITMEVFPINTIKNVTFGAEHLALPEFPVEIF